MIYLDSDGVIANFVDPVMKVFGAKATHETLHTYELSDYLGLSHADLWGHKDVASFHFWANLPKMRWADQVVDLCLTKGVTAILTQGIRSPQCWAGKKAWKNQHFKNIPLFVCEDKCLIASGEAVLIDDHEKNIEKWRANGGIGILFPAPYNSLGFQADPIPYLKEQLDAVGF